MSTAIAFLAGAFFGTLVGVAIMALIQPYCCRLQPEEDN